MPETLTLTAQQQALAEVQQQDFRARNLLRLVSARLIPGSTIDVGCGVGGLVAHLLERGRDARGVDTSPPIVEAARRHLSRRGLDPSRITVDTPESLAATEVTAENVVAMDCLEHVADDDKLFATLVRLVRPNGRLLITVPALMLLYGQRDQRIGHHRRYARERLLCLAAGQPLIVEEIRYWNLLGVLPTLISDRILRRPIDESFRYGSPTLRKRLLRRGLDLWFRSVENRIRPPTGLTLLLVARRQPAR